MSTLPKYIARGGEVAWIGLSGYRDVELYGFAIKADPTLVHDMWSRYVGEPSQELGVHIDVRGTTLDHVLFVFVDSERHQQSRNPGSEGRYREQLFAVVVLGYRRRPDPGLVLFAPYLCASDTPGWEADREIYGYPRVHGKRADRPGSRGNTSDVFGRSECHPALPAGCEGRAQTNLQNRAVAECGTRAADGVEARHRSHDCDSRWGDPGGSPRSSRGVDCAAATARRHRSGSCFFRALLG